MDRSEWKSKWRAWRMSRSHFVILLRDHPEHVAVSAKSGIRAALRASRLARIAKIQSKQNRELTSG